jgi:hypothetical protein
LFLTDWERLIRVVVVGSGLEKPLATYHELKTIYTLEDLFYFLEIMSKHNAEVKAAYDKMNR